MQKGENPAAVSLLVHTVAHPTTAVAVPFYGYFYSAAAGAASAGSKANYCTAAAALKALRDH